MLAANTLLNNRFRIISELGRGGMGAVYEARDEKLGSFVALKQNTSANPDTRRDFAREAKLLARLNHEAFPHVGDFFEDDAGGQYFVMQLVRGQDLGEALRKRGRPFAVAEVARWAVQLLEALEVLHAYPVVHRDIKPSNIKLTEQNNIKLLDFGIAKGSAGGATVALTSGSMNFATKEYAPIEQILRANGEAYLMLLPINEEKVQEVSEQGTDARSDLYALGATLYHFLTGKPASSASVRAATLWAGRSDSLLAPEVYNASVPPEISRIVCRALALERDARYPDAATMRRDFEDFRAAEVRLAAEAERRRIIEAERQRSQAQAAAERQRWQAEADVERQRLQAEAETQKRAAEEAQRQAQALAAKLRETEERQQAHTAKLLEQSALAEEKARQAEASREAEAKAVRLRAEKELRRRAAEEAQRQAEAENARRQNEAAQAEARRRNEAELARLRGELEAQRRQEEARRQAEQAAEEARRQEQAQRAQAVTKPDEPSPAAREPDPPVTLQMYGGTPPDTLPAFQSAAAVSSEQSAAAVSGQQSAAAVGSQQSAAAVGSQQSAAAVGSQQSAAAVGSQQSEASESAQTASPFITRRAALALAITGVLALGTIGVWQWPSDNRAPPVTPVNNTNQNSNIPALEVPATPTLETTPAPAVAEPRPRPAEPKPTARPVATPRPTAPPQREPPPTVRQAPKESTSRRGRRKQKNGNVTAEDLINDRRP